MARVIHYFIPSKHNNHKPYLTRHPGLASILIITLLVQTTLNVFLSSRPQILGFATSIYQQEVITLTNQQRQSSGLGGLTHSSKLDEAARLKALDMFENDYWAHVSPAGVNPWHWFNTVGYGYTAAGENLARDFDTSAGVVSAWMASPSHRENILYPTFKEIGVAVVNGNLNGEDTTLVVQLFATPAAQPQLAIVPAETVPTATIAPPTATLKPVATLKPIATATPISPTKKPSPGATSTPVPPTPTETLTPTPTITATPTPAYVYKDDSKTEYAVAGGFSNSTPADPFGVTLAVVQNLTSFSISRLFTIMVIGALIFLFGSESFVLWQRGIPHPHAQRLVHVGILILALLGTIYGAGGNIL